MGRYPQRYLCTLMISMPQDEVMRSVEGRQGYLHLSTIYWGYKITLNEKMAGHVKGSMDGLKNVNRQGNQGHDCA